MVSSWRLLLSDIDGHPFGNAKEYVISDCRWYYSTILSLAEANNALRNARQQAARQFDIKTSCQLTISRVHTLRIQTFSVPCTPSTSSSSTPSHQHRLAGLRQNSSSFCAMPTALLLVVESPRMSVRRRASAIEQTTALLGSAARWPQVSARSKPL